MKGFTKVDYRVGEFTDGWGIGVVFDDGRETWSERRYETPQEAEAMIREIVKELQGRFSPEDFIVKMHEDREH